MSDSLVAAFTLLFQVTYKCNLILLYLPLFFQGTYNRMSICASASMAVSTFLFQGIYSLFVGGISMVYAVSTFLFQGIYSITLPKPNNCGLYLPFFFKAYTADAR